jgi:uncharacterized Zn finger protein
MQIKPISKAIWTEIQAACEGQLDSLQELLEGRFPKGLMELFTAKGTGLFPSPKEIEFKCSCPDWAHMCKHVAAVLYGIGTRLDEDPSLFFVLRKMKMDDLITQAVRDKSERLLRQAKKKTSRVIDDADLGDVFGIDLESAVAGENGGSEATTVEPGTAVKARRRAPAKAMTKKQTTKKAKTVVKKTKRGSHAKMKK